MLFRLTYNVVKGSLAVYARHESIILHWYVSVFIVKRPTRIIKVMKNTMKCNMVSKNDFFSQYPFLVSLYLIRMSKIALFNIKLFLWLYRPFLIFLSISLTFWYPLYFRELALWTILSVCFNMNKDFSTLIHSITIDQHK